MFVLGSFEKRVTVYAQQVRALNLVDAIISENLIRADGKVAIIGGGAAGITAAAAFARAMPKLAQLDLFEARSDVLELQRGSARYLHPHFYDWPNALSGVMDAGLPIMNWKAGPAGEVAAGLKAQFDGFLRTSILSAHLDQRVEKLSPSKLGLVRVFVPGVIVPNRLYDLVILAIGFGLERYLDNAETRSYWSQSDLAGPIHLQDPNPLIFISGNGDGGLVDLMMAAFNGLTHQEICEFLIGLDFGAARAELEAIEVEGWAAGADLDFLAVYRARVRHLIPAPIWAAVTDRLRPNARIMVHTKEAHLLRRTTALHNRLGVFLAIEADADRNPPSIELRCGANFTGDVPRLGPVTINGSPEFTPQRRYLRLGADGATNLDPFKDVLATYPGATTPRPSELKPASPILSASARDRFSPPAAGLELAEPVPMPLPAAPLEAALAANAVTIRLSTAHHGQIAWSGDVGPAGAGAVWANGQALHIVCDIDAASASSILPAIARLGVHTAQFTMSVVDVAGWRAGMSGLCAAKALPGPNIPIDLPVASLSDLPILDPQIVDDTGEIARILQEALDAQLLAMLHAALFDVLGPAAQPMGWPIEPALRVRLWARWQEWHHALLASPPVARRFLSLLAIENDDVHQRDADLVRLGPKILRPYLTEPSIFGLTFSVCSVHALAPATAHPGNIATDALTGHSCGVSWIAERQIGLRGISQHVWTTAVVLLAQLREAFQMREGDVRMDREFTDPARVGLIAESEEPLVIGAEDTFFDALQAGEAAVAQFFGTIFEWRARAANDAFEEPANGTA